ncbi:MAG: GntR family transcriptional regulator [Candidatus Omnitrophica bacterium]|nr:GntR family transcriptional regulator [Candidatus Omnitrophota bacterium]
MNRIKLPALGYVDKKSPIPRYYQISQSIKELLTPDYGNNGDYLPSERKLAELFGVSHLTIRKALDELVKDGLLEKEWGKGVRIKKTIPPRKLETRRIGLTLWHGQEMLYHPGQIGLIKGVKDVLCESGYSLEILFITREMIRNSSYEELRSESLDGVVVTVAEIPDNDLERIESFFHHVVFCNRADRPNSVSIDWRDAMTRAVKHLLGLGHRKIGLIKGPFDKCENSPSILGYTESLREAGIDVNPDLILSGYYTHKNGFYLTRKLLKKNPDVTAIILGDDFMALGALDALRSMSLECPKDISIVAFQDFPFASTTRPSLTTIRFPLYTMGRTLAEMLLSMIKGGKSHEQGKLLKGELIIRKSSGPYKQSNKNFLQYIKKQQVTKATSR